MMKRGWCIVAAVVLTATTGAAGIGTWKNFTSMKDVNGLARDHSTYWAATSGGLFGWTEGASSYQMFTSAEGLQSVNLTAVAVDANGDVWTGTSTGVLQVVTPKTGSIRTLLSIAGSDQTNKQINAFAVYGDTLLISTDFGLSLFRIGKFEFGDTYTRFGSIPSGTRTSVLSAVIFQGYLWAAVTDRSSTSYIARASLSDPNLISPGAWTLQALPAGNISGVAVANGRVYAGSSQGLFFFDGTAWSPVAPLTGFNIVAVYGSGSQLFVATGGNEIYSVDASHTVSKAGATLQLTPTSITGGTNGSPVTGTIGGGLLTLTTPAGAWTSHFPNGPNSNQFVNVAVDPSGNVWCASGAANGKGMYRYDGQQWISFTRSNSPLPINEFYRVSVGCDGSVWGSSWGRGVVEFPSGAPTLDSSHVFGGNVGMGYTITNPPDLAFIATSNVVCDGQGNSWVNVFNAANRRSLAVRQSNGVWKTIPVLLGGVPITQFAWGTIDHGLAVDANDNLWAAVHDVAYGGVISLGNAGTIDSTVYAHITSAQGLPSDVVNTVVVDQENTLWVGTDKGIGLILDPSNPLRTDALASYKPLLGLSINTIAVDPLNQKWVGTSGGVFLLSPDGTQQLASYTVENTGGKLIDNDVKSIAVDQKTGTVYFGTNSGLASLTTAAAAPKTSFDGLRVYPNPYRIPSSVPLTVDGLVQNSTIKILATDGSLVRELTTPGGRIGYWDGKDEQGNNVASGVYIIVAYSDDGSVANGKVAVIRK